MKSLRILRKYKNQFFQKKSKFSIYNVQNSSCAGYPTSVRSFWFNIYHSKKCRFRLQNCDRLIFNKNHEGYLMKNREFSTIWIDPKKNKNEGPGCKWWSIAIIWHYSEHLKRPRRRDIEDWILVGLKCVWADNSDISMQNCVFHVECDLWLDQLKGAACGKKG